MILSSEKSPVPTFHVNMPAPIHVHPPAIEPVINVHPAELRQEIVVQPAELKQEIIVHPVEFRDPPVAWTFRINRDGSGKIETITATPS